MLPFMNCILQFGSIFLMSVANIRELNSSQEELFADNRDIISYIDT
jgi:hypothetical protein